MRRIVAACLAVLGLFMVEGTSALAYPPVTTSLTDTHPNAIRLASSGTCRLDLDAIAGGLSPYGTGFLDADALTDAATSTTTPAATTTTIPRERRCGQPFSNGDVPIASDCLFILQAAVGASTCDPACICNVNGTGGITASDALLCLKNAVGQSVELVCPCNVVTTTTTSLAQCGPTSTLPACGDYGECGGGCPGSQECVDDGKGGCTCTGTPVPCGSVNGPWLCGFGECPSGMECKATVAVPPDCVSSCVCESKGTVTTTTTTTTTTLSSAATTTLVITPLRRYVIDLLS